ncbi:MAG: bi-domain-containing oxidoreductase [Planctomycetota bacterium]|jgi:predicted dehydrogenase
MRQILQNLKSGETQLVDVPCPAERAGHLLIATRASLVSAGTERMLVEFGQANLLAKAKKQPEKVKQVLAKVKTDGLLPTLEAVQSKLNAPIPLGYCNAGVVIGVGKGVEGYALGDRVVSNGPHAEVVSVPVNLCSPIPDSVCDEDACFGAAAAIALQGIRLANPTLGERFVVTGLGLIGLLTVQLLRATGCEVLGLDFSEERLTLAAQFGATVHNLADDPDPQAAGITFSGGNGVDGVLITASTASNDPVHHAAQLCRQRGRIVLVGVTGLALNRADFYEKELSFQVSCSYGPGRYDAAHEEGGQDYPFGLVRWTEGRNFQAVLRQLASGALDTQALITHRIPFDQATDAYRLLTEERSALGIVLTYEAKETDDLKQSTIAVHTPSRCEPTQPVVGILGAGNYASRVLIPAFKRTGVRLKSVVTGRGLSGTLAAQSQGIEFSSTDLDKVFGDGEINTIVIATRHNSHASLVKRALDAGKHIFVEKPLALNGSQLAEIQAAYEACAEKPILTVGFNRRYAPQIQRIQSWMRGRSQPAVLTLTVNAGSIPADHWTQNPALGGGRLIGEACHFIDLLTYLCASPIASSAVFPLASSTGPKDTFTLQLTFADGSTGTIHYLANGHALVPKERLEVFCGGAVAQLDNFRTLRGYGIPGLRTDKRWTQDKGQDALVQAFLKSIQIGGASPTPLSELVQVHEHCFQLNEALLS